MERHVANARAVAEWLEARDDVERVAYASLPSSPWHARAEKYTPRGSGSVLAFEISGGLEAGKRFVEGLELHSHVANIGDVRSLVIHPASTTHSQLSEAEQVASGVSPGPGAALGRARARRRHPRGPRGGVPGGEGGLSVRAWQDGDPVGGRRARRRGRPAHRERRGAARRCRVAYESWGTPRIGPDGTVDNAVLVLHALTGDSHVVGPAGPGHPSPGWWGGVVGDGLAVDTPAGSSSPPTCSAAARAPPGPAAPPPTAAPGAAASPTSPSATRSRPRPCSPTRSASGAGPWSSAGPWAACGPWSGPSAHPERVGSLVVLASTAAASGDQIAWCAPQLAAITSDPAWLGGDYHGVGDGPGGRARGRPAHRPRHLPLPRGDGHPVRPRPAAGGGPRHGRAVRGGVVPGPPGGQAGAPLRRRLLRRAHPGHEQPRRGPGPGRDGGRAGPGRARRTTVVGINSDRLYPLEQQEHVAGHVPGARLVTVPSRYGHDGFLVETAAVAGVARRRAGRAVRREAGAPTAAGTGRRAAAPDAGAQPCAPGRGARRPVADGVDQPAPVAGQARRAAAGPGLLRGPPTPGRRSPRWRRAPRRAGDASART